MNTQIIIHYICTDKQKNIFMKKINYFLIIVLVVSLSGCSIFNGGGSDKTFEGYIKYSVDYEGEIDEQTRAQLPTSIKEYFKGTKSRKDQESAMYSISQISHYDKKQVTVLMDMMGQKIAFKQNEEDMKESMEKMDSLKITETSETKEILDYTCKKLEIEKDGDYYDFYVTDEITVEGNPYWATQYKNIDGVLMQYTAEQQGMVMTYTAEEVVEEKVKASKFTIPNDYELKSAEELKSMFGG